MQDGRATCAEITANASKLAGVGATFLASYPDVLNAVLSTGRKPTRQEIEACHGSGRRAAESGVPLQDLLRCYLIATRLTWREALPESKPESERAAEAGFRAVADAVAAVADGYENAHRLALRQEEAARREFIDDLFHGSTDLGTMAERAQRFGLRLAESHVVIVIEGDLAFHESTQALSAAETALCRCFDTRDLLFTTKDESLVCVAPGTVPEAPADLADQVSKAIGGRPECRIGISRAHQGPGGVRRSYDEARASLAFADRLDYHNRVVKAADFLVFQVLLRDRAAIDDLIATVLAPLRHARGGARPLIETLASYFACGTIHTAAEQLNLSVRAVSYRLDRVRKLTGYSATDPGQRFPLEAAVLGAKILDWPPRSH
ncbi:PucR family transcriptional regulator [Saccharopolyspora mangrovi]|uniref:Helix-turn-helix domain-containing protein n=1 Tax=Saccharopolyspora mangrovi TaxID=3082379 RepID=A0ABU6A519_9PSEU|nr:helix-turn-helix domain-containing protein [Saccharopolyspora sp. S2-29]MEB3366561.1 helix-turn-helix domain-containing protein [Saccharopolyspora sp. S2-29]